MTADDRRTRRQIKKIYLIMRWSRVFEQLFHPHYLLISKQCDIIDIIHFWTIVGKKSKILKSQLCLTMFFPIFCNILKLNCEQQISYLCSPWKMAYIKLLISSLAQLTMLKYKKWTLILGKLGATGSCTILKWEVWYFNH